MRPSDNTETLQSLQQAVSSLHVRSNLLGSDLLTMAVGGPVAIFCEVQTLDQLQALYVVLQQRKIPFKIIGAGSNIIISDKGLSTLVLRLGSGFRSLKQTGVNSFEVGAAYSLMTLSRELSNQGFSGLEFAGGIPASLGGAVVMNAGAHASDISQITENVQVLLPSGKIEIVNSSELKFSYRHSDLPEGAIVISAELKLSSSDRAKTAALRTSFLTERKSRQPLQAASSGSIFRNPSPEKTAGFLIENCGLKGSRIGGAQISELHANWIINPERTAKCADIRKLIGLCKDKVREKFSLELKEEVIYWE